MATTITATILAGGRGKRMGETDKGLQPLRDRSLVEWVLECIDPQVDELLIIANRNLERYLEFGYPVLSDRIADFAGPLAGLHAGLSQARSELVLAVPCDTPLLPVRPSAAQLPTGSPPVAHVAVRPAGVPESRFLQATPARCAWRRDPGSGSALPPLSLLQRPLP